MVVLPLLTGMSELLEDHISSVDPGMEACGSGSALGADGENIVYNGERYRESRQMIAGIRVRKKNLEELGSEGSEMITSDLGIKKSSKFDM